MKIIVFGAAQLAELVIDNVAEDGKWTVEAVTVEEQYIEKTGPVFNGIKVVPFERIEDEYPADRYKFIVCVGYVNMNDTRRRVFEQIRAKGYDIVSYIHPSATVLTRDIGEGTLIFENAVIGRDAHIGTGNIFYPCSLLAHHSSVGDFNFFAISSSVAGNVSVGSNCFFGNNSCTKNGISIADYTLVGAGCYLSGDTQPYDVYVPARAVRLTDKRSTEINL